MAQNDVDFDRSRVSEREGVLPGDDAYRILFERSADANLIIENETFIDCNQATVEMLGYTSKDEVLRTHPSELSPPTQPDGRSSYEKANEMIALAIAKGSHRFEWNHLRANGEVFPVEVLLTAITIDGRPSVHVVWRDITERKQLEEQLRHSQKMKAIGRLAGGIAHDFNNLLVAIMGNSEMLEMRLEEGTREHDMAVQIRRAGERAATLVRQLLAFSRKQDLEPTVVDLDVLIHDMRSLLKRIIGEHIELVTIAAGEPLRVKADVAQLEQVILNLVSNARDAMPRGGTITITASRREDDERGAEAATRAGGAHARLVVSDDGDGMSPEARRRAFDPFFTTKPPGKGTGLGLSMVYGAVRQNGGDVTIESTAGVGTSVVITLPLTAEEVTTETSARRPREPQRCQDATILVVEDEDVVSDIVARVLRDEGYEVLLASNGREAFDLYVERGGDIDLLVSDVVMPELSGPELVTKLRAAGHSPGVLFTSGYSDSQLLPLREMEGIFGVLAKPYSTRDLTDRVRKALETVKGKA